MVQNFGRFFWIFLGLGFFCQPDFLQAKNRFFRLGAPLRGALGRAPPPFSRVEILKKFTGKSVLEKCTLFFGKNIFLVSKRSDLCLVRQISSRGSGRNFFYPKLIGNRQSYDIFFSNLRYIKKSLGSFNFFRVYQPIPNEKSGSPKFLKND